MGINLGGLSGRQNNVSSNNGVNALNLKKNDILDLTKKNPGLGKVVLGAGWDVARNGQDFDLDIAAFLLDKNNGLELTNPLRIRRLLSCGYTIKSVTLMAVFDDDAGRKVLS